ncbi:tonB-system energizer ExbB [Sulfitobacter sp.]|uniref:tonB-system energizer ExbB n=1 Tax=Sulfitobacter sp. TaxID=1903071 RepID=UPI003002372F
MTHHRLLLTELLTTAPGYAFADTASVNVSLIEFADKWIEPQLAEPMMTAAQSGGHTPLAMFMAADIVVKLVMFGLALASVLGWAVWTGKLLQVSWANARLRRSYKRLSESGTVRNTEAAVYSGPVRVMVKAAQAEIDRSAGLNSNGIKERVASELSRIKTGAARAMQTGAMVLGSIGSTAPFIGLFGTVWGIMNSFIGIPESGSTNLSVVAPGIAEALLATAIGLVAAIPAVMLYNHITRLVSGYRAHIGDAAALVERCLSRDLDRIAEEPPAQAHLTKLAAD